MVSVIENFELWEFALSRFYKKNYRNRFKELFCCKLISSDLLTYTVGFKF